jgi:uncharacterized protein
MVQIAGHPGIYIEEFTPPSPIEGVGTSTVAFVGTAARGPIGRPRRLFSWDAFVETFGGFLAEQPASYLAPAVHGFFLNGGTDCFVLRAGSAVHASANLLTRRAGSNAPVLVVEALEEGPAGNDIFVEVADSSYLADQLPGTQTALDIHRAKSNLTAALPTTAGSDRHTIRVQSNAAFRIGERVVLETAATTSQEHIVASKQGTTIVILAADAPGNLSYSGGWLRSADIVPGQRELLVEVPTNVRLSQAVPHATVLLVQAGATREVRTVQTAGDGAAGPTITLTEGMRTRFDLNAATLPTLSSLEWDLVVTRGSDRETFPLLSMHPEHPGFWGEQVVSELVVVHEPPTPPANPADDPRPRVEATMPKPLLGGLPDDRAAAWAALETDPTSRLDQLRPQEEIDVVCIPGLESTTAQEKVVAHAEELRRFAILDSPFDAPPTNGIGDHVDAVRGTTAHPGHAALYYPWLLVRHPQTNREEYWPPSGHLAGVYARTDQRGVHVAPANEVILGAIGLERTLTDREQAPLNLEGINVLRIFAGVTQPMVWGARTTHTQNKYWQYVNIRRLFLFIEKSIEQGIRYAVFQPNNPELWERLKRSIGDFLLKVWQDGALGGATPKESFYVRIDEALNPERERALGRLYIEIGVRPAYPAEFVVVRIGIWEGGSSVSET